MTRVTINTYLRFATTAAIAGASERSIMQQTGPRPPLKQRTMGTSQTEPLPQGRGVVPSAEVFHFGLYRPILP